MKKKNYESPQATIYRFDDNDLILTASGTVTQPEANYAAKALNEFMDGTNTTIEK